MGQQKLESAQTVAESKSADKRKRKVTVGSVWESKNCGEFEVVEYSGCNDVLVRFINTGFETRARTGSIRSGYIKDRLKPSVYGVGFFSGDEYPNRVNGKVPYSYRTWSGMLQRCYSDKWQERRPTYKGCTVCPEWHDFKNFLLWFEENYPQDGKDYQLDKDIRTPGSKVYSPETCLFVDLDVNNFVTDSEAKRGLYMIGVSFDNDRGKFLSHCCDSLLGRQVKLGRFTTELEAHLAWRKRKSELAYELAMVQDRGEVKQALLNWKRALDNFEIHKIKDD